MAVRKVPRDNGSLRLIRRATRARLEQFDAIVTAPFATRSSRVAIAWSICLVLKIGRYFRGC